MITAKVLELAIALVLVVLVRQFSIGIAGQTNTGRSRPNNIIAKAQQFVSILHPDLGKQAEMRVTIDHAFGVPWDDTAGGCELWVGDKPFGSHHPQFGPARTLFTGKIVFSRNGSVWQFFGYKEATRLRIEQLSAQVKRRRDWSERDVIEALEKAGAWYGPDKKETFKANMNVDALELFVSDVHIKDLEFQLRDQQEGLDGKPEYTASLQWWAHAEARSREGEPIRYTLGFEPFEGRLSLVISN